MRMREINTLTLHSLMRMQDVRETKVMSPSTHVIYFWSSAWSFGKLLISWILTYACPYPFGSRTWVGICCGTSARKLSGGPWLHSFCYMHISLVGDGSTLIEAHDHFTTLQCWCRGPWGRSWAPGFRSPFSRSKMPKKISSITSMSNFEKSKNIVVLERKEKHINSKTPEASGLSGLILVMKWHDHLSISSKTGKEVQTGDTYFLQYTSINNYKLCWLILDYFIITQLTTDVC
jgi:hypothetical protein